MTLYVDGVGMARAASRGFSSLEVTNNTVSLLPQPTSGAGGESLYDFFHSCPLTSMSMLKQTDMYSDKCLLKILCGGQKECGTK